MSDENPKKRILVVEDEGIVAMDLTATLERLGYAVIGTEARGEDAVERARKETPDLIMMDIRLAGNMDGIEAALEIQTQQDIPFVFLTAYTDEETLARAKKVGPYAYAVKPYEERELRSAIEIALYKHEMERRVRESEGRLAATLRSIGDAVIVADGEGNITFLNQVAATMLAVDPAMVEGRRIDEGVPLTDHAGRPVAYPLGTERRTISAELHGNLERAIPVEGTVAPVRTDGARLGWVVVLHDVTQQRITEAALRELSAIVTSTEAGILSLEPDGVMRTWNAGCERLVGISAAEAIGSRFASIITSDDAAIDEAERAARDGDSWSRTPVTLRRPDGSTISVGIHVSPMLAGDGSHRGASVVLYDLPNEGQRERAADAIRQRLLERARKLI